MPLINIDFRKTLPFKEIETLPDGEIFILPGKSQPTQTTNRSTTLMFRAIANLHGAKDNLPENVRQLAERFIQSAIEHLSAEYGNEITIFIPGPFFPGPQTLTSCQAALANWNALEPRTNPFLLEYYEELLSKCQGPEYTAAVNEIKSILSGLRHLQPSH